MSNFNLDDTIPEVCKKNMEISQQISNSMAPLIQTQEAIKAITRPIREMTALNSTVDIINAVNSHIIGDLVSVNGVAQIADSVSKLKETIYNPIGLAAINMSNFHIDTSAIQMATKAISALVPNYTNSIQGVLDSFASIWEHIGIQSPFLNWLNTVDASPLTRIWEHWDISKLFTNRYKQLHQLHLQTIYKAKWFPYASTLADEVLFDEINEIIFSSRIDKNVSKRCEKRIDRTILSYYTPREINRIKKQWNAADIKPFIKKSLRQVIDAYLRKEYALVIPFLATMWEGIIRAKIVENTKEPKEDFRKLVDKNGYDDVFSDFYNNLIIGPCYSTDDVIDGVPNRHGVAHGWYVKYPTQKAALNAILFTHFLINLKPNSNSTNATQDK